MASYSVKLLFVARSVVNKGLIEPPAAFYSGVLSNQVILLIFQQPDELRGNRGLQGLVATRF